MGKAKPSSKKASPSNGKGVKVVIFDYGGTLFKATRPWHEVRTEGIAAAHARLKGKGLGMTVEEFSDFSESVFARFTEMEAKEDRDIADRVKYRAIVDSLFSDLPVAKRDSLALEAKRAYWDTVVKSYPLRRSTKEALRHLKSRGIRMGIVSNHHDYESLVGHLEESGIAGHFESVLASEREGVRKPNALIFARSLESLGVGKEDAIFVGDSLMHDIAGARAAGITSVLIDDSEQPQARAKGKPESAKPDYVIKDLVGLREVVSSLQRGRRRTKRRKAA